MATRQTSSPTRLANREKQEQALKLRSDGMGYDEIAAVLGYASRGAATNAVQAALTRIPSEKAAMVREIESIRLNETMLEALKLVKARPQLYQLGKPTGMVDHGTRVAAMREVVRISERLSKLYGADAPTKKSVTVITEDALVAEMRKLEEELGNAGIEVPAEQ